MFRLLLTTVLSAVLISAPGFGQAATPGRQLMGEVASVDAAGGAFVVKADKGGNETIEKASALTYKRVDPITKDMKTAEPTTLGELQVGDRVLVLNKSVIVMSKKELAKKHEADAAEWTKRGTSGVVKSVKPETKEIMVEVRTGMGPMAAPKPVSVAITEKTQFKRYAPDSVKFSDAKDASLKDITKDDQMRVLGTKSEDGAKVEAEVIVFGTFKTVAGTITKIDPATGLIDIKPLEGKALTVKATKDSNIKKMPPMMATMMGGGGMRGPGGPPRGEGGGRPAGAPGGAPGDGQGRPAGGPGGGPGGPGAGMFSGGARSSGGDLNAMLEHMPALPLTDLKVGDQIIVSSTKGATAEQMTAITILTGVEALIAARPAAAQQGGRGVGAWSMDIPVL